MQKVKRKGFTLLEVIIALSLIALLSTLFIANLDKMFSSLSAKNPENTLSEVLNRAANLAQSTGEEIKLSYDEESNSLVLSAYVTDEPIEFYECSIEDMEITFEPVYPDIIDGSASTFYRAEEVDCIRFFPDATSSRVRITMKYNDSEYAVVFDNFSPIKVEKGDDD